MLPFKKRFRSLPFRQWQDSEFCEIIFLSFPRNQLGPVLSTNDTWMVRPRTRRCIQYLQSNSIMDITPSKCAAQLPHRRLLRELPGLHVIRSRGSFPLPSHEFLLPTEFYIQSNLFYQTQSHYILQKSIYFPSLVRVSSPRAPSNIHILSYTPRWFREDGLAGMLTAVSFSKLRNEGYFQKLSYKDVNLHFT